MDSHKTKITIGRDPNCDVPLTDSSVSRLHAELIITDVGQLMLRDCRSSNGTILIRGAARQQVQEEVVYPSDRVQFGRVPLYVSDLLAKADVHIGQATAAQPAAPAAVAEAVQRVVSQPVVQKRMVRCECGTVKPADERCPVCSL